MIWVCLPQGSHPYQSLSYTSGDTAADSPAHVSRVGMPAKDSPRKESLLSYLTGSFPSLHNLLEGTPQRNEPATKSTGRLTLSLERYHGIDQGFPHLVQTWVAFQFHTLVPKV